MDNYDWDNALGTSTFSSLSWFRDGSALEKYLELFPGTTYRDNIECFRVPYQYREDSLIKEWLKRHKAILVRTEHREWGSAGYGGGCETDCKKPHWAYVYDGKRDPQASREANYIVMVSVDCSGGLAYKQDYLGKLKQLNYPTENSQILKDGLANLDK